MPVLGITGGVASGKSTFAKLLLHVLPGQFFDSDQCVKDLLEQQEVLAQIREKFGTTVFDLRGDLDKTALREIIFGDSELRAELERILHPRVRALWSAMALPHKGQHGWVYVDIPLLFETGAEESFDKVVVVACSSELQEQRLMSRRSITPRIASQIIASQLDFATRMDKADHIIWNAGSIDCLESQVALFASYLQERYG